MLLHDILKLENVGNKYYDNETELTFEVQYHGTLEFICIEGATCLKDKRIQEIYELTHIVRNEFELI